MYPSFPSLWRGRLFWEFQPDSALQGCGRGLYAPPAGDAPVRDGEAGDSGSTDGNMVIRGGEKTKEFWDGTIQSEAPALENPQYLRRRDGLGGVILCMYTL